jgi:hypothetical protein
VTDGVLAPPIRARSFDRRAAVGGVVFVVLDLIVAVLGGEPPTARACQVGDDATGRVSARVLHRPVSDLYLGCWVG